ncbi:MAG TPA: hypothetical protein VG477_07775 [Thermoanaerobaculia bacterium]|nr:hypothetical protein [Thermoanaerobaculia bacterium]
MRRRIAVLLPVLLAAGWLLTLFGPVLSPERALANRDIAVFHLPLRQAFRELAAFGTPFWNPWVNGGQPVLSNPNYGAFYPPSWLIFLAPPHYALSLLAMLHGAIAFAGAWRLARRRGCGAGAAALAGVGYAGCGAYFSLLSALPLFLALAWLPWLLAWADEALWAPPGEPWLRPALLAGAALGLQLIIGEPAGVVMSGLALLALTVPAASRRLAAAPRILVPFVFGLALAAVQLVPTLGHLADSPRTGLPAARATIWSMRPERLAETVFPRFYGDSQQDVSGLFFGWKINDRSFPYVESLYPGLLLAVLGAAALLRGPIPRRAAWALAVAAGFFLALGRHNPMFEALRETVPLLSVQRFPEKFVILSVLALSVAGVLGWQRLLDEREAGRPQAADFPLAMALVTLATALGLAALVSAVPRLAAWFIASYGPGLPPAREARAVDFLLRQGWVAVGTAAAVAALLALCRWRRPSRRLLEALALALLAADLWYYGHGLLRTIPAAAYRDPPPLAASLLPARDRVFLQEKPSGAADMVVPREGDPRSLITRISLARLDPHSGLLWHIPYVFNSDFDLMLTGWGRTAESTLAAETKSTDTARLYRYLGVWNVRTVVLQGKAPNPSSPDPLAALFYTFRNPHVLARLRFAPQATFHPDHGAALAAARAAGWKVGPHEHLVRPGRPTETVAFRRPPRASELGDDGSRIRLAYTSEDGAFFIAAMTFDPRWRPFLDGKPWPAFPTAAGQLAVQLPPGEHRLVLAYRDPLVPAGASLSLVALVAGVAIFAKSGRRPRMA